MKKIPIILDTDPGIDDALALILLSKHQQHFDIKLFSATAGNNPIATTTKNLKYFATKYFNEVPVAIGSPVPLSRQNVEYCEDVHGKSGLGTITLPPIKYPHLPNPSHIEMYNILKNSKQKITIISLGAMTNIAKLIINYPEIKPKIERIYAMIGSINGKGNIKPYAEFNAYFDSEALTIVANSGIPLTINPFELANNSRIKKEFIDNIEVSSNDAKFAKELMLGLTEFDPTRISLFDLHSIVALYKPELYEFIPCEIDTFTNKKNCGQCKLKKVKESIHYYQTLKNKDIANTYILNDLLK